jgi:hypothetical protein
MVPEPTEPDPPVEFRVLLGDAPLAGTSESVFVVEPGLLAPDEGACAEAAVTPNRSAAAAIAVMAFITFPLSSENSDGFMPPLYSIQRAAAREVPAQPSPQNHSAKRTRRTAG